MTASLRHSFFCVFCVLAGTLAEAQQQLPAERVDSLLGRFAHADDMGAEERAARAELINMGTIAMPHLKRVFGESGDDYFRTNVAGVMFKIDFDDTAQFVESELQRPPSEWKGKLWVFGSLLRMRDVEPGRAVRLAKRVLEMDETLTQMCALGLLRDHGSSADLEFLQEYLARRQAKVAGAAGVDGVAFAAKEAIDAIRRRGGALDSSVAGNAKQTGKAPTESAADASVQKAASGHHAIVADTASSAEVGLKEQDSMHQNRWLWLAGGLAALSMLALLVRRRRATGASRSAQDPPNEPAK